MHTSTILIACGLLAGCAAVASPPASEEERTTASNAAFECLDAAVRKFDDHVSDASSIAIAAVGSCEGKLKAMDDVFLRQETQAVRRLMAPDAPQLHLKIALRSVLAGRRGNAG